MKPSFVIGVVAVAVVVGIGFAGLAICLLIICCGVVCLHKSVVTFCFLYIICMSKIATSHPSLRVDYSLHIQCHFHLCRFYAEYSIHKKLCEKSELRYNYVQMPDDLKTLDNAHLRAPVDDLHHARQLI